MPALAWLLNLAYLALLAVVSPILVWRMVRRGKYRAGWRQKLFGLVPRRIGDEPCVWFHAVSLGEVLQLRTVLAELARRRPDVRPVVTTTTASGYEVACRTFPDVPVHWFPLDFSWSVKAALGRIRPSAVAMVELELWPNFVLAAERRGIPVVLINGRVSERSFDGYRRLGGLMRRLLRALDRIAVQNAVYARRLIALGAPPEKVVVTGSIKFDHARTDRDDPRVREIAAGFGLAPGAAVLLAGSTQAPEERLALDAWRTVRAARPDLRLILVPRHPERFDEVAQIVLDEKLPLLRRSELRRAAQSGSPAPQATVPPGAAPNTPPVLLLDTLGELASCWGLADVAVVGGSFGDRGGQNMIEPAAYGAAVVVGPNTRNFRDVVDALRAADAIRVANDATELTDLVGRLFRDRPFALGLGQRAREVVLSQQGATTRTLDLLLERLPARVEDVPTETSLPRVRRAA